MSDLDIDNRKHGKVIRVRASYVMHRAPSDAARMSLGTTSTHAQAQLTEANDDVDICEGNHGVLGNDDAGKKVEATVLKLHLDAAQRLHVKGCTCAPGAHR